MAKGRPREFDIDSALDAALRVFWRRGFEGASLEDLTDAMGINRPSLYAAFGSKEGLFRRALERYMEGPAAYVREALELPTARAVAERLLRGSAERLSDPDHRGCLVVQGALVCGGGEAEEAVRQELAARRAAGVDALRERFARAPRKEFPAGVDRDDLARYVFAVIHGMAVQAAGGATREELARVAEVALRVWPA